MTTSANIFDKILDLIIYFLNQARFFTGGEKIIGFGRIYKVCKWEEYEPWIKAKNEIKLVI